jgi:hypothetical protein
MGDKGGKKDKEKNKQQPADETETGGAQEAGQGPAKDSVTGEVHRQQAVVGKASCQIRRSPFTRDHEFRWEIILGAGQPIAR